MKKDMNIDELLNSFVDGELTERQKTEVQRLISHDAKIAQRLSQLQKCRMLVASLPYEQAPEDMVEQVKVSLERKTLLDEQLITFDERKGARQLMFRKVLAAAAMIGLVAVLASVIYTIVTPESATPATGFKGRLELKTNNLLVADTVINKAIKDNDLADSVTLKRQRDKNIYTLVCSRDNLSSLLANLKNSWEKFDSATLFVETKMQDKQVVIDNVNVKQIVDLITPPKPQLTGEEKISTEPTTQTQVEKKVHLTIVVTGNKTDN